MEDEINLVKPGFNSGWIKVHGLWQPEGDEKGGLELSPDDSVDFGGKEYTVLLVHLGFYGRSDCIKIL